MLAQVLAMCEFWAATQIWLPMKWQFPLSLCLIGSLLVFSGCDPSAETPEEPEENLTPSRIDPSNCVSLAELTEPVESPIAALSEAQQELVVDLFCKGQELDTNFFMRFPSLVRLHVYGNASMPLSQLEAVEMPCLKDLLLVKMEESGIDSFRLSRYANLERLTLQSCGLTKIPATLSRLKNLSNLSLSGNTFAGGLTDFPAMEQLKSLGISRCGLTAFEVDGSALPQLEKLLLSQNDLTAFPTNLASMKALKSLAIGGNDIAAIPGEISGLKSLEELSLTSNQIAVIPAELAQLTQLRSLWLYKNNITELPVELAQLQQLEDLRVHRNAISEFPVELTTLANLKNLDLSHCNLTELPAEIANMQQLTWLNLDNNPWKYTDEEKEAISAQLPNAEVFWGKNKEEE